MPTGDDSQELRLEALPGGLQALVARAVEDQVSRRLAPLEHRIAELEQRPPGPSDRATLLVFSNDLDRLLSAFILATGAVAMGLEATMFFTFWGLTALKRRTSFRDKDLAERLLSLVLPHSPSAAPTSQLNLGGLGPKLLGHLLRKNNVQSVPQLLALARELGVELIACRMSMGVMGVTEDELVEGITFGGVATYLGQAADSRFTLFV